MAQNRINTRPWHVQVRTGKTGPWQTIAGEQHARRESATHRMIMWKGLSPERSFRVVHVKDLPRTDEN